MFGRLSLVSRWFDKINQVLAYIACTMLVLIIIAICVEIVTRSFSPITNPWLIDLSEITLLYSTFLAAAWVLGNDKHVSLDLILETFAPRTKAYVHCILSIVAALACFVVCWFGILVVKMAEFCLITPPIGLNCFVVAGVRDDITVQDVFRGVTPFLSRMLLL